MELKIANFRFAFLLFYFFLIFINLTTVYSYVLLPKSQTFEHHSNIIIRHVNSKTDVNWKAKKSKFEKWPIETIKGLMGVLPQKKVTYKFEKLETIYHSKEEIPVNFDARVEWPECDSISEVRDQGSCGSCWAFGAAEAISDRICIKSGGKINVRISAQELTSCTSGGCNGGLLTKAWKYFQKNGIVSGGNYKSNGGCQAYTIPSCDHHINQTILGDCGSPKSTPKCKKSCFTNSSLSYTEDKRYGESAYKVANSESQIQIEIMKNGPVEASFNVFSDFLTYNSGVYQYTIGDYLGGHAVKLFGWGVENGVKFWWATNSWNSDWGDNGYFKILRGSNHLSIESDVHAGIPLI